MESDPLAALKLRFAERCRQDRDDLRRLSADGELASPDARRLIHGLAGAAGSFGFGPLSEAAAVADEAYGEGRVPDHRDVARVLDLLDDMLSDG
jgi:Hpt domain.